MKITQKFYKETRSSGDAERIVSSIISVLEMEENDFFVENMPRGLIHAIHLKNGLHIQVSSCYSSPYRDMSIVEVKLVYLYEKKHLIPTDLNAILNLMEEKKELL